MGDIRGCSPEPNGGVLEEKQEGVITAEYWRKAEDVTQGIIAQVQPTVVSEERRKSVIGYVQRLIGSSVGCEVFPFGSVPLKTYLPDGDIDLTAFGGMNVEEALANDVCSVLEREDQNRNAKFIVKDIQLIRAEVKLVKCLIQNIVVDISFNQLGGLSTLCFLEQVDRLIGKDHLFKRSIILIKAWCYYESRLLGAHHALISTYALETLVLYIFHLFNSSLDGPLAVLYKFLDYFSKFDWDNYCISLNGPVRISSLPEVVVEAPENGGCDLLLTNDFLKDCVDKFSVHARGSETNSRAFPPKHLNIVDPLKENNNLGRSVSKGNFYRIRSAFIYGARKLGCILSQPEENIANELSKFFSNTLHRHGSGQRPDVQDSAPTDGQPGLNVMLSLTGEDSYQEDQAICESKTSDCSGVTGGWRFDHEQPLHGGDAKTVRQEMSFSRTVNGLRHSVNGTSVSENRLSGDAKDLATSRMQGLSISNNALVSSAPSVEESVSPISKAYHAPHLHFSCSVMEDGEVRNVNPEYKQRESSGLMEKRPPAGIMLVSTEDKFPAVSNCLNEKQLVTNHEVLSPVGSTSGQLLFSSTAQFSEDPHPGHSDNQGCACTFESPETLSSLSDLTGNFENHLNSLRHAQWWCESAFSASVSSMPTNQFLGNNSWDVIRRSLHYRRNAISQMNVNGSVPRPVLYPMNPPLIPCAAFGMEEMPKTRGTGTYFPNANHYRDKMLSARGRSQGPVRSPRSNGRIATSHETSFSERISREHEMSQAHFRIHQGGGKFVASDIRQNGFHENRHSSYINGSMHRPERAVEFGSIGHPPWVASITEVKPPGSGSAPAHDPSLNQAPSEMQGQGTVLGIDHNRIAMQSYHLKDEDDFPPLSDHSWKGPSVCTDKKVEKSEE